MTIAYWIVAIVTALAFAATGVLKLVRPREALISSGLAWAEDFSSGTVKALGAAELVGVAGIILPFATQIAPILSPIAAIALVGLMIGAAAVHLRRKENVAPPVVFALLAAATAVLGFVVLAG